MIAQNAKYIYLFPPKTLPEAPSGAEGSEVEGWRGCGKLVESGKRMVSHNINNYILALLSQCIRILVENRLIGVERGSGEVSTGVWITFVNEVSQKPAQDRLNVIMSIPLFRKLASPALGEHSLSSKKVMSNPGMRNFASIAWRRVLI